MAVGVAAGQGLRGPSPAAHSTSTSQDPGSQLTDHSTGSSTAAITSLCTQGSAHQAARYPKAAAAVMAGEGGIGARAARPGRAPAAAPPPLRLPTACPPPPCRAGEAVALSALSPQELVQVRQSLEQELQTMSQNALALQSTAGKFAAAGQAVEYLQEQKQGGWGGRAGGCGLVVVQQETEVWRRGRRRRRRHPPPPAAARPRAAPPAPRPPAAQASRCCCR